MKNYLLLIIILIIGGVITTLAYRGLRGAGTSDNRLTVVATFYPLAHFAETVGGEKVRVVNVTTAGVEPHDFEPTPQDMATIQKAKLFLLNGAGLDPWAEKIEAELVAKGVKVIKMSDHMDLVASEAHEEHGEEHAEGISDPHFWLDPLLAQEEVEAIASALAEVDPASAGYYQANAASYKEQLTALDRQYQSGLTSCAKREIITSHNAFGYLAKRYTITVHSIAGLSPDEEPSAQQLAELTKSAREKNIRFIFFETLVGPKLAETLAQEVGAEMLVFNPIEGLTEDEMNAGKTYISIMEENLNNLRIALACQ